MQYVWSLQIIYFLLIIYSVQSTPFCQEGYRNSHLAVTQTRLQVHRSQYLELVDLSSSISVSKEKLKRNEFVPHLYFLHLVMMAQNQLAHQITKLQGIRISFLHPGYLY